MTLFYPGYGATLHQYDPRLAEAFGRQRERNSNGSKRHAAAQHANGNPGKFWFSFRPEMDGFIAKAIIRSAIKRSALFETSLRAENPLTFFWSESARTGVPFATLMYDIPQHVVELLVYELSDELAGIIQLGDIEEHVLRAILGYCGTEQMDGPRFDAGLTEQEARQRFCADFGHPLAYKMLQAGCSLEQIEVLNDHPNPKVRNGTAISEADAVAVPIAFAVAAFSAGAEELSVVVDAHTAGISLEILGGYLGRG
jgi:hypothetical protein